MMMIFTSFGVDKRLPARTELGYPGSHRAALRLHLRGCCAHQPVRLDIARIRRIPGLQWCQDVLNRNKKEEINALEHPVVKFMQKRLHLGPLVMTVVFIEFCDLIFAFDSIPAVFSVSLDPFMVFFSNIFAILGLRALFFLLAAIANKFRYLKVGVVCCWCSSGVKMLIHDFFEIDAVSSLVFIILVLLVSIGASVVIPQKQEALEEIRNK